MCLLFFHSANSANVGYIQTATMVAVWAQQFLQQSCISIFVPSFVGATCWISSFGMDLRPYYSLYNKKSGKKLNSTGRQSISPKKHFFLFLVKKFPIFASCFLECKREGSRIFFHTAQFAFTISNFRETYLSFIFFLHILFSLYQYAWSSVKFQQSENIQFVDEKFLLWEKLKTLIRPNLFDGREN